MGCGVTVLAIYAFVASIAVLVLGSLLISLEGCDEESLVESCKDLKVDGGLTGFLLWKLWRSLCWGF